MMMNANRVLAADSAYNTNLRRLQVTLACRVGQAHDALRFNPPGEDRYARAADAMAVNGMYGFRRGVNSGLYIGLLGDILQLPLGASTRLTNHALGRPMSVLLGGAFVGNYQSLGPAENAPQTASIGDLLRSRGVLGPAIEILQQHGREAQNSGLTALALACLWGACLLSVANTVGRTAVFVATIPIAIGYGLWLAAIASVVAGFMEVTGPCYGPIVDFQDKENRYLRHFYGQ